MKHIEAYGTGIQRIFDLYAGDCVQPDIIITDNTFTRVLPNRNANKNCACADNKKINLSPQEEEVIGYIRKNGSITDLQLQMLLNVKKTRAYLITRAMKDKGIIISKGIGSDKRYFWGE